jgi:hypothetical protein
MLFKTLSASVYGIDVYLVEVLFSSALSGTNVATVR